MRISKSQIKYIKSLQSKKYRQKYNKFIVEGAKLVSELISFRSDWIEWIVIEEEVTFTFDKLLVANQNEFRNISSLTTPSGILAVVEMPPNALNEIALSNQLSIYLDTVMDPGNMGTIIRTAEWFGIAQVICSPGCVDPFNPKVVQGTMGSILRVPIVQMNLNQVPNIEKYQLYMTSLEGENIVKVKTEPKGIIVVGNESQGISKILYELPHRKLNIPPHPSNQGESLNVGIATALIIYQLMLN
jgi:TrmH family RNA methyltransferase